MQKDSYSFWKDIKHIDNAKISLASKINDCVGDTDICKMWKDHYQSLLNNVKNMEHKTSVANTLSSIENESIEIRPLDIVNVLKRINKGKACGVDGLAAEHFIYADERIHVILSILFNCVISHGYLPSKFMNTANKISKFSPNKLLLLLTIPKLHYYQLTFPICIFIKHVNW